MTEPTQTHSRRWWLLALALLAVSIAGFGQFMSFSLRGQNLDSAADRSGRRHVVCFGYVDLENGVTRLHPTQPGRVAEILVREGDVVPAGAPLLRLADDLPRARAEQARLALEAARADLAEACVKLPQRHQLELQRQRTAVTLAQFLVAMKRIAYDHKRELQNQKALVSKADVALAKEELETAQLQVRDEEDKLKLLELHDPATEIRRLESLVKERAALHDQALADLAEFTLRAPRAGMVLRIAAALGDPLGPGSRTYAIEFAPDEPRIVRAEVEQAFAAQIAPGLSVSIEDGANAGGSWTGRIVRVSDWFTRKRNILQEPDQFNDVRTLECVIALDPDQRPLRINQRVLVTIHLPRP
jgi:multidrug resistance efflux pump